MQVCVIAGSYAEERVFCVAELSPPKASEEPEPGSVCRTLCSPRWYPLFGSNQCPHVVCGVSCRQGAAPFVAGWPRTGFWTRHPAEAGFTLQARTRDSSEWQQHQHLPAQFWTPHRNWTRRARLSARKPSFGVSSGLTNFQLRPAATTSTSHWHAHGETMQKV